jgi:hypothetical protein
MLKQIWDRDSFDVRSATPGSESTLLFADITKIACDQLVNVQFKGVYFLTQKLLPVLADG